MITLEESHVTHGESLEWLDALPSSSAGGVLTDPPYSSGGQFRGDRATGSNAKYINRENQSKYDLEFAGDNRDQRSWAFWCEIWLRKCFRIVRPGGTLSCFVDWRQLPALTDAVQAAGWTWRGIVPWDKTEGTRPQLGRFRAQAEYVVWGSKGALPLDRDVPCLPGVIKCPVLGRSKEHPTEKPTDMLRIVSRFVSPGETIIDPFAGSGDHGVAAILEGHPYLGCEVVPGYAAMAQSRVAAVLALTAESPSMFSPEALRGSGGQTSLLIEDEDEKGESPHE